MSSRHEGDEFVAVLKLNMLQDNPGAVKKVSSKHNQYFIFLLVLESIGGSKVHSVFVLLLRKIRIYLYILQ